MSLFIPLVWSKVLKRVREIQRQGDEGGRHKLAEDYYVDLFWTFFHVGWGCRIHRLLLCRGVRHPDECPWYDTKQSDDEVSVMEELWGMQSAPLLPSLPSPLWPGVIAPARALSMGQTELNCIVMLNWIVWNVTVYDIKTVLTLSWIVSNRTVLTFNCV